jgi:hypothetical protein
VAEVERAPPIVVEKQAVCAAGALDTDKERDRFVDRVGRGRESGRVRIPVGERVATAIEHAGLVTHAEDMLAQRQGLAQCKAGFVEPNRLGRIGRNRVTGEIGHRHPQAGGVDVESQLSGGEAVRGGDNRHAFVPNHAGNGPARVFAELAVASDPNAQDSVGERSDADAHRPVAGFDSAR